MAKKQQTEEQAEEILQERIGEISDLLSNLDLAREVLAGAESVEVIADFKAEVREARKQLLALAAELEKLGA